MRGPRPRWILLCVGLMLVALIAADAVVFPRYFRFEVYFEWEQKTGFNTIYVSPPNESVGAVKRLLGDLIAFQARPFISAELKKSGWVEARGVFLIHTVPFLPIVTGLSRWGHSTLVDPKVTPLMRAAELNNLELVKRSLASGADVNARDQRGWTPLMHACMSRVASKETIQRLIAAGADVNAKDGVGRTALIWASGIGAVDTVHVLLAAHAEPNARSQYGETPLQSAVDARSVETAAQLLMGRADPNARVLEGGPRCPLRGGQAIPKWSSCSGRQVPGTE